MDMDDPLDLFPIRAGQEDVDWGAIKNACNGTLSNRGIKILRQGLDSYAKTVVLEKKYICKDHRNLFSNYYSKRFHPELVYCNRLHFFSTEKFSLEDLIIDPEQYQDRYLGYSVIRPVANQCLGRTIIEPYKIGKGEGRSFHCLVTPFKAHFAGLEFSVNGYPHISQDTEAMVCAHAALWGVCRYLSERYTSYRELFPYDLVEMSGTQYGRRAPYRGMTYFDYSHILSQFGCYPLVMTIKGENDNICPKAFQELYTYVESGFPVLASIGGHAIALIGHTIDYEKNPTPDENNLINSSKFLKQFVVSDDNFFPYALFGHLDDPENYGREYLLSSLQVRKGIESVIRAVCPLPEKVFLQAPTAENKAKKFFLLEMNSLQQVAQGPYVLRFFLTNSTSFKARKREIALRSFEANDDTSDMLSSFVLGLSLPHFIWVMEISTIEAYKRGYCIGEVVLDSTASQYENKNIYLRIGNKIWYNDTLETFGGSSTEFQQYRHNLGE